MLSARSTLTLKLLFILFLSFITKCGSYQVIQQVGGVVGAGEYILYKVEVSGNLALSLVSDRGDGDLYVSMSEESPTFEQYDLASQSLEDEIVIIPQTAELGQLAMVGVYGHVRHNLTEYRMYLIKCDDDDAEFFDALKIANDPMLINLIKQLRLNLKVELSSSIWKSLYEWTVWILLRSLEFGLEVFL